MSVNCRTTIYSVLVASAVLVLGGCGATSSSDIKDIKIGKQFSVTGHWTGTIVDVEYGTHAVSMTLNDSTGSVQGTMIVPTHDCLGIEATSGLGGEWSLQVSGTATQAAVGTEGDNILTPEQENSNSGTLDLETGELIESLIDEAGNDIDISRIVYFSLNGKSESLTGRFSGTWIGIGLFCRSGIQGTVSITRS